MNKYYAMKQRHEKEINSFPMFSAFNEKQFARGMKKLGLEEKDTDKIYHNGYGGFYRKTDSDKLFDMLNKLDAELQESMKDPDFAFQAFDYELANHEYNYTMDHSDALEALGLTEQEIRENPMLAEALKKAKANQSDCF